MRKAQSTIEYIMVIGVLAASLIAMGAYMKRGIQGNVRGLGDQLGDQYEPGGMTISNSDTTTITSNETIKSTYYDGNLTKQETNSFDKQELERNINEKTEPTD